MSRPFSSSYPSPPRPASSRSRRRRGAVAVGALVLGALPATTTAFSAVAAPDPDRAAPVLGENRATAVEGRYIVVMEPRSNGSDRAQAQRQARARGGEVTHSYAAALSGFAARLPEQALQGLRNNPHVAYIEADQQLRLSATQPDPTWGLDRVDQRNRPLNGGYTYDSTGAGVTAYVIDTGIRASHSDLGGRVGSGYTAIADGRGTSDCNGHGTHVAGTVGGAAYGVAKQVSLRPVRVLDCAGSGSNSGVIAGVDWVTSHHSAGAPAVANMSLGGGVSSALDSAVTGSINDGVTYVVAAGNENTNACNGSPSRVGAALTVGSTTSTDARSSFSNYGSCLDLFAPGSSITSAWHTGDTATSTISGTSMAAPHAAGAAALYLQGTPTAAPATVSAALVGGATTGLVTGAGSGSPNRLLYSLLAGGTTTPPAPTGNLVANPGFEAGATAWSATSGVITNDTRAAARTGSWKAWLNGYGTTRSDSLSQSVAVPAASRATFSFHLLVSSAETTSTTAYDKLSVQLTSGGSTTTLATFSNLDETSGYVQRSFDVSAFAGRTVTVRFVGTEDSSAATSFVVDDTSVTTG